MEKQKILYFTGETKQLEDNLSVIILNHLLQIVASCRCNGTGFVDEEVTYYEVDDNGKIIAKKEIQSIPCPDCSIT